MKHITGKLIVIGDDADGNPSAVVSSTRDSLSDAGNALYQPVEIVPLSDMTPGEVVELKGGVLSIRLQHDVSFTVGQKVKVVA